MTQINLTVLRGSGADDINLSAATIEWLDPNEPTTLSYNSTSADGSHFTVTPIKHPDGSAPVIDAQSERFTITMVPTQIGGDLGEGPDVTLKITTQYGSVTLFRANIPQSLSQESAVTV